MNSSDSDIMESDDSHQTPEVNIRDRGPPGFPDSSISIRDDMNFSLFVEPPSTMSDFDEDSDVDVEPSLMTAFDDSSRGEGNRNLGDATSVITMAEVSENRATIPLHLEPSSSRHDRASVDPAQSRPIPKKRTIFFAVSSPEHGRTTDDSMMDSYDNIGSTIVPENSASKQLAEVVGNLNVLQVRGDQCCNCKELFKENTVGVSCSRNPTEDVEEQIEDLTMNKHVEVHKLCGDCVIQAGTFAINDPSVIAGCGVGMNCVDRFCNRIFLISEMRHFFPENIENELQEKILLQNMEALCRENSNNHVFKCSQCGYHDIVDESFRFHECQRCKSYRCWICGRRATKAHEIRSCEEMTRAEEHPSRGFLFYNAQALKPPRFV